jgi:serine/threonine-protein kinase
MPANPKLVLLDLLRDSGLLQADQVEALARLPEARDPDPNALARQVFQRGWLTRFQITQIAKGRARDLRIGTYIIMDRLGEGGMGAVFKAQHQHMSRIVALKVIRKDRLSHPKAVQRFYKEVKAAGQLHHPNIVLAFDAGDSNGTHFLSMEYVDGQDLSRVVQETGPLPVPQACDYIRQAALGLQHAHERGLVHRDIKPSNLLVTLTPPAESMAGGRLPPWGTVKVLDLGLARLDEQGMTEQDRALTRDGAVLGTPDFLAPEQALGAHTVDARADLYSLGCTFYFLLSGGTPFHAESVAQLLLKHQLEHPVPLETVRSDVPEGVRQIIDALLAKEPQDRIQTGAELAAALAPFCGAAATAASVPAASAAPENNAWAGVVAGEEQPRAARKRAAAPESRTVALDEREEAAARPKKEKSRKARKAAEAEAAEKRQRLVLALVGGGVLVLVVGALGVGSALLLRSPRLTVAPTQPSKSIVENGGKRIEVAPGGGAGEPAGTGRNTAATSPASVKPAATPGAKEAAKPNGPVTGLAFDPDTQLALAADGNQAYLWNLTNPKEVKRFAASARPTRAVFGKNASQIYLVGHGKDLESCNPHDETKPPQVIQQAGTINALAVSPDGNRIYAGCGDRADGNCAVHVWSLPDGRELSQYKAHGDPVVELTLDKEGRRALSRSGHRVSVWETNDNHEVWHYARPEEVTAAVLFPDGKQALLGTNHGLVLWDLNTDQEFRQFAAAKVGPRVTAVAVSGDGLYALSGNQAEAGAECNVCVWDVKTGAPRALLAGHSDAVTGLIISKNNRLVGSSGRDGTVRFWRTAELGSIAPTGPQ